MEDENMRLFKMAKNVFLYSVYLFLILIPLLLLTAFSKISKQQQFQQATRKLMKTQLLSRLGSNRYQRF